MGRDIKSVLIAQTKSVAKNEQKMTCSETKVFLKQLCDDLGLSVAYFCYDSKNELYLILKKNNASGKYGMKKILFGENDQNKNLLTEILPELIETVKSQGWK